MGIIPWNGIFVGIFLCIGVTNTVAYSKFGRKCSDIGCPSNQVCVLVEEPCTRGNNGACGQYPTCTNKPAGGAPRRPGTGGRGNGDRGRPYVAPKPIPPTPPPRTSSNGYGSRYPYNIPKPIVSTPPPRPFSYGYGGRASNSIGSRDPAWNRDYDGTNRGSGSGRRGQSPSTYNGGQNNHNTHVSIDSSGNRVWTFSRSA